MKTSTVITITRLALPIVEPKSAEGVRIFTTYKKKDREQEDMGGGGK